MNFTVLTPLLSSRFVSPKFIHFVLIGIVSIISFSSCAQRAGKILPQKETAVFFFDTRKYADQDFFITPFEYGGEHAVLGEIIVVASEGIMTQQDPKWKTVEKFAVLKDEISHVAVIDSLVTRAKEIGADGLIGFRT